MGPIAFVLVFLLVPLAAAVLAVGFFAAVGIARLAAAVPTGAWAVLAVGAVAVTAARLWLVVRMLRSEPDESVPPGSPNRRSLSGDRAENERRNGAGGHLVPTGVRFPGIERKTNAGWRRDGRR